jgi:hypothetical protein
MFSVLADGPGRYRLEDGTGADVGWIRGRSIGFRGLRNEAEVIVAASAGWRTLQSVLHREYAAWPRQEVDWERLRFVSDGAYQWVSDGRIPLARVYRTRHPAVQADDVVAAAAWPRRRLAVEFVVPSWMHEDSMTPLAHALWHVLTPLLGQRSSDVIHPEAHRRFEHVYHSPFHSDALTRHQHAVTERHEQRAPSLPPDGGTAA